MSRSGLPGPPRVSPPAVRLVRWSVDWIERFADVRARILAECGDAVVEVFHIGSTAIPGMDCKPVLDVMPTVHSLEDGKRCIEAMAGLGFDYYGPHGMPSRHYFKRTGKAPCNAHVFAWNDPEVGRHIRFRDYLRRHVDARISYERLKTRLAVEFAHDLGATRTEGLIREIDLRAAKEYGTDDRMRPRRDRRPRNVRWAVSKLQRVEKRAPLHSLWSPDRRDGVK